MENTQTRREFLIKTAITLGGLGTSLMPSKTYAQEDNILRVGYLPITDAAPLLIAHARGYFHEEGLKVQRPFRVRSWSALAESFLSGKFDVTHMLLPIPIWMRFKNKTPVKILAWNHTNGSAITVRGDSDIKCIGDLGGKQICVPHWYSVHNIILQMGLKHYGLKPVIQAHTAPLKPDEVNIFMLSPSEMPAALAGGKSDGYIVAEPFNAIGEIKIKARIMRFTGDIWKNHPCCVVVMNENITRRRPVYTQKIINSIVRAQLWIIKNTAKAAKILSRDGDKYLPVSEKVLLRAMLGYDLPYYGHGGGKRPILHPDWKINRIGFQPYPYQSATRLIVKEMRTTLMEGDVTFLNSLNADFAAKDIINDTFVKKAIALVGGPQQFNSINASHPWKRKEIIEI